MFKKLIDEKQDTILNLNEKTNFNNLTYNFKDKHIPKIDFNVFDNAIIFFKKDKRW